MMSPIATVFAVPWSVCRSVCLSAMMYCAKTAQRIKMIFSGCAATVSASMVLKFDDNRPKGSGVEGVIMGEI